MTQVLFTITWRLLACCAISWLVWDTFSLVVAMFTVPLFGIALARPIQDLVEELYHGGREITLRDRQGKHYMHKGMIIDIEEDDEGGRWVLLDHVRKVIERLPQLAVLEKHYPDRACVLEGVPGERIRADALVDYLKKATDPNAVKFKVWLERDVLRSVNAKRQGAGKEETPVG